MRDSVSPSGLALILVVCAGCGDPNASDDAIGNAGSGSGGANATAGSSSSGGANVTAGGSGGTNATAGSSNTSAGTNATGGASAGSSGTGAGGAVVLNPGNCPTRPALTPGVWQDITPADIDLPENPPPYGIPIVELDPSDPCTLYACADEKGVWRTTDAGTSWERLGTPPAEPNYSHEEVSYLDSPIHVVVDPNDSQHLYATQGVRGITLGFWVSTNGGTTWSWPPGFVEVAKTTTNDVTILATDPGDFNHALVGSHSPWQSGPAGIMETTDGGETFIAHAPAEGWSGGSLGINFLHEPTLGIGDGQTWLVGTDFGGGFFRTTDAGATYSEVAPDLSIVHGGQDTYYTSTGVLYVGGQPHPSRSTDNGLTWEALTGTPSASYYSVKGDGNTLYTQLANTGDNAGHGPQPYVVSDESDGLTWAPYKDGVQTFSDGPFVMRFDAANRILYSANWDAGVWALKVDP